jgi:hypothetical protein
LPASEPIATTNHNPAYLTESRSFSGIPCSGDAVGVTNPLRCTFLEMTAMNHSVFNAEMQLNSIVEADK